MVYILFWNKKNPPLFFHVKKTERTLLRGTMMCRMYLTHSKVRPASLYVALHNLNVVIQEKTKTEGKRTNIHIHISHIVCLTMYKWFYFSLTSISLMISRPAVGGSKQLIDSICLNDWILNLKLFFQRLYSHLKKMKTFQ